MNNSSTQKNSIDKTSNKVLASNDIDVKVDDKKQKNSFWKIFAVLFAVCIVILVILFYNSDTYKLVSSFFNPNSLSIKETDGRTNIILLGKGGLGHEAPDLTDTIIFVSIPQSGGNIVMLSLPRDIWVMDLRTKLNSVYYWGNQKNKGGGLKLVKEATKDFVGQEVHYVMVVDFNLFKQIIDEMGGIVVDVENSFIDERFPISGKENDLCDGDTDFKCRYQTISFNKGLQHMDGETALKFVRSRNAEGDEGTDLARGARQEKVVTAIKNKLLTKEILLNPKKVKAVKNILINNVETDLEIENWPILARYAFDSRENLVSTTIPQDFLEVPPKQKLYDNLYVFIPKSGNWDYFQEWVRTLIASN